MAAVNTSGWIYANWQEESDPATRLTKLAQHITEARQAVVTQVHSEGRSQSMNTHYIAMLEAQLKELRAANNIRAAYLGHCGPTVARPQF